MSTNAAINPRPTTYHHPILIWLLLILHLCLTACTTNPPIVTATPTTLSPTAQPTAVIPTPTLWTNPTLPPPTSHSTTAPTRSPDTGWQPVATGMEYRIWSVGTHGAPLQPLPNGDLPRPWDTLYAIRWHPDQYQIDIHYRPGDPLTLAQWQTETDALLIFNGGFFTPENIATGRIIYQGVGSGLSYGANAGMLTIDHQGMANLRWLGAEPYRADESLWAGLQSFPMLVKPGGVVGYTEPSLSPARRTVLARDMNGRWLVIATTRQRFTLAHLSQYLTTSDLNLDIALNLDGGSSTALLLQEPQLAIPPFTRLPIIITVNPHP
ncbi:MAG TPA: phosphodiester glycosidase family protein [Anaerolineae bacterium]|nr:phosphodiester glycosidase family protein [Anaerolineae bacterium]